METLNNVDCYFSVLDTELRIELLLNTNLYYSLHLVMSYSSNVLSL